jgi:hypothetical protein
MPAELLIDIEEERKLIRGDRPGETVSRADVLRALVYEGLKVRHRRRGNV